VLLELRLLIGGLCWLELRSSHLSLLLGGLSSSLCLGGRVAHPTQAKNGNIPAENFIAQGDFEPTELLVLVDKFKERIVHKCLNKLRSSCNAIASLPSHSLQQIIEESKSINLLISKRTVELIVAVHVQNVHRLY
jgi:hypothetical protein